MVKCAKASDTINSFNDQYRSTQTPEPAAKSIANVEWREGEGLQPDCKIDVPNNIFELGDLIHPNQAFYRERGWWKQDISSVNRVATGNMDGRVLDLNGTGCPVSKSETLDRPA